MLNNSHSNVRTKLLNKESIDVKRENAALDNNDIVQSQDMPEGVSIKEPGTKPIQKQQEVSFYRKPALIISDFHMEILEKPEINCKEVRELLYDYTENEIIKTLRTKIEQHIDHCICCKNFYDSYNQVITQAGMLKAIEPSEDVKKRLREKLNERLGVKF
jgi:hypothetical protein